MGLCTVKVPMGLCISCCKLPGCEHPGRVLRGRESWRLDTILCLPQESISILVISICDLFPRESEMETRCFQCLVGKNGAEELGP